MSSGDARGRSFHDGRMESAPGAVNHGYNFQEQWQRAFDLTPPFVMVTGWNEWIAGRWGQPGGPLVFVDQFDQANSRDIEPMKGGHGDNYYWQLVANVRRFKGAPALPSASQPKTIRIDRGFEQWHDVAPEFADHVGETAPRDHDGAAGLHYANRTGRNDLAACKVARDSRNVYFYVRAREAITPSSGTNWMWLLIDADQNPATGWEGFDYIINRTIENGKTWLEKNEGGWHWKKIAAAAQPGRGKPASPGRSARGAWPGWRKDLSVIRFQMGRQLAASRRYHGCLHQRRCGSGGKIQIPILRKDVC